MKLRCGQQVLDLSRPQIMGILNVTQDSFSDGGQFFQQNQLNIDLALKQAEAMVAEGAAIIDVGGESTRPGAQAVTEDEELERVVPVVEAIKANLDVIVSVDTSAPKVMAESATVGAGLINDVRALQRQGAIEAVASLNIPVCLMHMQGQPGSMQANPHYEDVVAEVFQFLKKRADVCIKAGVKADQILIDPGFGFGKTLEHNLSLLANLSEFGSLPYPLLVGLSRKSMLQHLLSRPVDQRLPGSVALALLAAQRGARIVRVHDVAATQDVLQIWAAIQDNGRHS